MLRLACITSLISLSRFLLWPVDVWFSSPFPLKTTLSCLAHYSFKSDFHSCSPLVSSSNFVFFLQAILPKASRLKYPHQSLRLTANNPQTPKRISQPPQPASQIIRTNSIHISRNSSLPTLSASNNPPQNRFTRHVIPPPSPSASNNPNGVSLLAGQG